MPSCLQIIVLIRSSLRWKRWAWASFHHSKIYQNSNNSLKAVINCHLIFNQLCNLVKRLIQVLGRRPKPSADATAMQQAYSCRKIASFMHLLESRIRARASPVIWKSKDMEFNMKKVRRLRLSSRGRFGHRLMILGATKRAHTSRLSIWGMYNHSMIFHSLDGNQVQNLIRLATTFQSPNRC